MRRISILSGLFLVLLFPVYSSMAADPTPGIILNEIQIEGTNASDEFIELRNISDSVVSLSGWKLQKRTSGGSVSNIKSFGDACLSLSPGDYVLWANSAGIFASLADFVTTQSLAKTNAIELVDKNGTVRDSLVWGDDALKGKSLNRDTDTFSWETSDSPSPQEGDAFCPAPGEEPAPDPKEEEEPTTPKASVIRINELFPNPSAKGEENEWIELRNPGDENTDISGFALYDASASGKYVFPQGTVIPGDGYLVVERSESGLSLNNTDETVSLLAPDESTVDTMRYEKTKEEASLSFDGSSFRWSSFLTPGKANRFGEKPEAEKTSIPEEGYEDVALEFSAKGSDGQSYAWDFGDGKTSRKQSTSHTYKKTGKYHGTLTITDEDGIGENVKEFTVDIEDFPKVRLSITAIAPNPKGADTGVEWISVKNGGKKKINLIGFGIATGSNKKKLTNHPVSESFIIKAGKEKQVTSRDASFTLPNDGGYVEIRRPDGKMVVGKSYKKSGGVDDDEVWRKIAGKSWEWVKEPSKNQKGEVVETVSEKESSEEPVIMTESAPVSAPVIEEPKEVTLEDLSPEQLALLEARVEERIRGQILAELEASGKFAAASESKTSDDSEAVLGVSDEKTPASFLQELNALLGRMLFRN
ncbi:MAG: lamin tail domain-containing protein [Candidatus Moranbacteria bacterium]|nr:lamin tail domain-containing protein [Candidatus Moranbacteria bacterium]